MQSSRKRLNLWLTWAMLGALAFLVMKIEFPIMPGFDYLKFDLSDALIAITTMALGPLSGFMITLIKVLLSMIFAGFNPISFVGDIAAFIATLVYIYPIYFISKKHHEKFWFQIGGILIGTISLTIIMSLANYFFLMPMYITMVGFKINSTILKYVVSVVVPFNLLKGLINGAVVLLLARTFLPIFVKFVKKHY